MKRIFQNLPIIAAGMFLISGVAAETFVGGANQGIEQPSAISGLQLWLSADAITGSDGDTINTWSDLSGNGNDMTSPGTGPTLETGILNGKAVLDFTTTESLENTTLSLPSTWTVIYITRLTDANDNRTLQAVSNNWLLGTWAGYVNSAYYEGDVRLTGDPADTNWHLYEGESDGTTAYFYANGGLLATSTTDIAPPTGGLAFNAGTYSDEVSDMQVAEVVAYDTALSDRDRIELENYFHEKYGIVLDRSLQTVTTNEPSSGEPPFNGLVGHWTFNAADISGSTARDSAGSNDGTINGATSATGLFGQALSFDGTSWVDLPISTAGFSQLTVSVWFKADSLTNSNSRLLANAHTDDPSDPNGFQLMFNEGGGSGFFDVGNGSSEGRAYWEDQLQTGVWYNYVGTYDGTTVRAYLNGVEVASAPLSGAIGDSGYDVSVGRNQNSEYTGDYFAGSIEDVRVYDRALSASEVRSLYTGTATVNASRDGSMTSGLVGLWSFDGQDIDWNDSIARDGSGNGADGTMYGMDQRASPAIGVIGQALRFENGAYIATGYTVPAQDSSTSFTWSAWAKLDPDNSDVAVILGNRGDSSATTWIKLTPTHFEYNGGLIAETLPVGTWVHVAIVKSGSSFTYYLDDSVIGTASDSDTSDARTFYIGGDPNFPDDGTYHGLLDDVRVYNRALSPGEVRELYLMGS